MKLPLCLLPAAAVVLTAGCNSMDITKSTDKHPVVDHGVSATILMPGQQAPGMRSQAPAYGARPGGPPWAAQQQQPGHPGYQAPAPGQPAYGAAPYGQPGYAPGQAGAYAPPAQNPNRFQSFGGSTVDNTGEVRRKSKPTYMKYLGAPLAIAAAPFKKLGRKLDRMAKDKAAEVDPAQQAAAAGMGAAPGAPGMPMPATREQAHAMQEQARLAELERQLAMAAPPAPAYGQSAATPSASAPAPAPSSGSLSIAEELARLRGSHAQAGPDPTGLPAPAPLIPRAAPEPQGLADHVEDRNGDGRPDFWSFKEGERTVREVHDADGNGTPDKTVYYGDDGQVQRIEEDLNADGRVDAWAQYRGGDVARKRVDSDHDGAADAWSFYRGGELARTERDTDGDGFKDRLDLYQHGRLSREEEDRDADGRPDRVTWYDPTGQVYRRDEDSDGDGAVDIRSHYEGGRLARRELLTDEALAELSRSELPQVQDEAIGPQTFRE
jgi:hypothetical protein